MIPLGIVLRTWGIMIIPLGLGFAERESGEEQEPEEPCGSSRFGEYATRCGRKGTKMTNKSKCLNP